MTQALAAQISSGWPQIIDKALGAPSGAHFYRCAFQVNPYHYATTYRGRPPKKDEESYIRDLINKAVELDIRVLAVTDHNHVGAINKIRTAALEHGITVFPGFELSSSEGIHILCLYPPDTIIASLERYLGELGIRDTDPSTQLSSKSFSELLKIVTDQDGITIAAHVTEDKGLLTHTHGQARIKLWQDCNLLAVQIPGRIDDLPNDKKQIICNKLPDYRRSSNPAPDLAIAVVNARDIVEPEDLSDPSATCWIKMSEISVDGLRQAFLDPISRIRLNTDPPPEEHAEFVAMAWQGGFLDEVILHFNENLNVLIGGRGAGKSTVIESLRYVLGLEPLSDDARKAHEGNIRHVLRSGTKISLLVCSYHPAKREYLIERTVPNPPIVRDETGQVLALAPADVMPKAEAYGQHEISDLTKTSQINDL